VLGLFLRALMEKQLKLSQTISKLVQIGLLNGEIDLFATEYRVSMMRADLENLQYMERTSEIKSLPPLKKLLQEDLRDGMASVFQKD